MCYFLGRGVNVCADGRPFTYDRRVGPCGRARTIRGRYFRFFWRQVPAQCQHLFVRGTWDSVFGGFLQR